MTPPAAFLELLHDGVGVVADAAGDPAAVALGHLARWEMADAVYLLLAGILGVDELDARLSALPGNFELCPSTQLALRCEHKGLRYTSNELWLVDAAEGMCALTVVSLRDLLQFDADLS